MKRTMVAVAAALALVAPAVMASAGSAGIAPALAKASGVTVGFVHFAGGTWSAREALVSQRGLTSLKRLASIDALAVQGPARAIRALRSHPWVSYLDGDQPLSSKGSTAIWATRVGVVRHPVAGGPYGGGLDGTGIGVAVVDSGVDATHPDLASRVVTNYKVAVGVDLGPNSHTDSTSGHGTHVSGIVAGDGTASQKTFTGVAPGAKLHVFSSGEGLHVLFAAAALDTIYTDYASFSPAIRVVNNSWGNTAGSPYNANGTIEKIVKKLVQNRGVVVTFSAGNNGGDGSADATSSYCKDPTPGVICVANYDDLQSGSRDGKLDTTSARGRDGMTATFPDISAPGSFITSTFKPTSGALLPLVFPEAFWAPFYGNASGTSMAAPHLAGVAALMLQAKPALTPAQVEDILLDNAVKFSFGAAYVADPQNAGTTTSFDKGAGLADAVAALEDPRIELSGANAPSPTSLASGDGGDSPLYGATDIVAASAVPSAAGITFTVQLADASDRPDFEIRLQALTNVDGRSRWITVTLLPGGGVAAVDPEIPDDAQTAEAASVTLSGNTLEFFVDYPELGDPAPGSPVHNISFGTYIGLVQDVAPSPAGLPPANASDFLLRPLFAPPITTA